MGTILQVFDVKFFEVNGVSYTLTWTSLTNWTLTAPLPNFVNLLALQGVDNSGQHLTNATDSITITNLGTLPPAPVVINEWMAANAGPSGFADPLDGLFQDWFELYNPNAVPVNLSGFQLTDNFSDPNRWPIPSNTVIAPHGFLLVWADNDTGQNGFDANGDLHANFALSRGGDRIGLYAPDGTPQHLMEFTAQFQNVSQGLFPDGDTNGLSFMTDWSPRASNRLGTPPAPQFGGFIQQTSGSIQFQAAVIPGRTYRVEYKDDLNTSVWTQLGANRTATDPILTISDTTDSPQRFYRLMLVP